MILCCSFPLINSQLDQIHDRYYQSLIDCMIKKVTLSVQGTGGIGEPAVLETMATYVEKPHPIEDPGFPLASPATSIDDEIPSSTLGPPLFS